MMTSPVIHKALGLSRYQLDLRIERGILPEPTFVDESGVRYFDNKWLRMAKAMLEPVLA